jgi:predicted dehydrogenase
MNLTDKKIRVAFLGVGWIGCNRMESLIKTNIIDPVFIADTSDENAFAAAKLAPSAKIIQTLDDIDKSSIDGVVIATPSGQHFSQVMDALDNNLHVFCQKPLARTKQEIYALVTKAKEFNRVLWVDMSYRYTQAMQIIKQYVTKEKIGKIYAIDTVFHNAYGPDKSWSYDPQLSGGGCVIDLGIHLIDLVLWTLDFPGVEKVNSTLFSKGKRIFGRHNGTEDYACSTMNFVNGVVVNMACSWNMSAGSDAVIGFTIYGTEGALSMKNHNGSFYDFDIYHHKSKNTECLCQENGAWGGKAAVDWAEQVAYSGQYNHKAEQFVRVGEVIDSIYNQKL